MPAEFLGIIVNGAISGVANRQHLAQALAPIQAIACGPRHWPAEGGGRAFSASTHGRPISKASSPPTDSRGRAARLRDALAAGKHVYTEKPFVTEIVEGKEILRLAAERGVRLGIVEDRLFMPGRPSFVSSANLASLGGSSIFVSTSATGSFPIPMDRFNGRVGTIAGRTAAARSSTCIRVGATLWRLS